jgi:hypothetical protein
MLLRSTILDYTSMNHAANIPHKTRQHNNSNNRHPCNGKEDKFVLKKQLTEKMRGLLQQETLS